MKKLSYSIIVMSLLISHASHASYLLDWISSFSSRKPSEQVDDANHKKFEKVMSDFQAMSSMTERQDQDQILQNLHRIVLTRITLQESFRDKIAELDFLLKNPTIQDELLACDTGLLIDDIVLYKNGNDLDIVSKAQKSLASVPGALVGLVTPRSYSTFGVGLFSGFLTYGFLSSDTKQNSSLVAAVLLAGVSSGFILHKMLRNSHDTVRILSSRSEGLRNGNSVLASHNKMSCLEEGQFQLGVQVGEVQESIHENTLILDRVVESQRLHTELFDTQQQALHRLEDQGSQVATGVDLLRGETKSIADEQRSQAQILANVQGRLQSVSANQERFQEQFAQFQSRLQEQFAQFQSKLQEFGVQYTCDMQQFKKMMTLSASEFESFKGDISKQLSRQEALQIFTIIQSMKQTEQTQQMICDAFVRKQAIRSQSFDSWPIYPSYGIFKTPTFSGSGPFNVGYQTSQKKTGFNLLLIQDASESKKLSVKRSTSQRQITDGKNVLDEIV